MIRAEKFHIRGKLLPNKGDFIQQLFFFAFIKFQINWSDSAIWYQSPILKLVGTIMAEGARMKLVDEKLAKHDKAMEELTATCKGLNETRMDIRRALRQIMDRLTALEEAPARVADNANSLGYRLLPRPVRAAENVNPLGNRLLPAPGYDTTTKRILGWPIPLPKWELPCSKVMNLRLGLENVKGILNFIELLKI